MVLSDSLMQEHVCKATKQSNKNSDRRRGGDQHWAFRDFLKIRALFRDRPKSSGSRFLDSGTGYEVAYSNPP